MALHRFLYRNAKRIVIAVIGGTVVLVGLVLIVTPGPAFVVIPLGLAILATEFVWAARLLRRVREHGKNAFNAVRDGFRSDRGESECPVKDANNAQTSDSGET